MADFGIFLAKTRADVDEKLREIRTSKAFTSPRRRGHTVRADSRRHAELGLDRLATLTIHHGRHRFISHALGGDRRLAEVRDADGNANVAITSSYLQIAVEDEGAGDLFGAQGSRQQPGDAR